MINNIEGQSKAELIKIIECQKEHDQQREKEIQRLQAEVERLKEGTMPDGYIAVPVSAWHEQCQHEQRAESLERERDEALTWVAHFQECSTKECMCGADMNVTCGHGGCISTAHYHAFPNAKSQLQKRDTEQQIKALEELKETDRGYAQIITESEDEPDRIYYEHEIIRRIEQLRNKEGK